MTGTPIYKNSKGQGSAIRKRMMSKTIKFNLPLKQAVVYAV
jgi:hypothetical protein